MKNTMTADRINDMRKIISDRRERSAWNKGIKAYALELLDNLTDHIGDEIPDDHLVTFTRWLLNGADNWMQYSEGGCALIYNVDIAERLCTASELKQTRNGERNPNSRETWLDVQARALFQAAAAARSAYIRTEWKTV